MKNYFDDMPSGAFYLLKKEALLALIKELSDKKDKPQAGHDYLTLEEAADFLGIKKATLYKMTSKKQIKYSKAFGKCYFLKENLIEIIKSGEQQTQQEVSAEVLDFMRKNHKK